MNAHDRLHNQPPITIPTDEQMLAELQKRFPEIDKRLEEWEKAFAGFPADIPLEQEDVAKELQDLLSQVRKESKTWTDSFQKNEKKPINALLKVVGNFFTGRAEKAEKMIEKHGPTHETFLLRKADSERKKAEAAAELAREQERVAREAKEKAEAEQKAAEERATEQRRQEEQSRLAAEKAKKDKEEAEERARLAAEKEKAEKAAKAAKDREEKEQNNAALRDIRAHMREANKLHDLVSADEASEDELKRQDELTRAGGIISTLATPVAASLLLDDEQVAYMADLKTSLTSMRAAFGATLGKREATKREKARLEEDKRQEELAAKRRQEQADEDAHLAATRKEREAEEAKVEAAKEEKRKADEAARQARDQAAEETRTAKQAGRDARDHGADADRSGNRADRTENRLERSTEADLSRTRGDRGSVGGLARHWKRYVVDEDALRAVCGPLGPFLTIDTLEAACTNWMRAHQAGFTGERVEVPELPGVVFAYETEARIA